MEKERGAKLIAIFALVVGVVGLSLGFAAFTKDLNITFEQSNVNVGGVLNVKLLPSNSKTDATTTVAGTAIGDGASALPATINDGTIIGGLGATFTGKGQSVVYEFYVYNFDQYDAYLTGIEFANYSGASTNKVCTAVSGTEQSQVDESCKDISLTIDVAGKTAIDTNTSSFTTPKLNADLATSVKVTITYSDDDGTHELPNGDFKINFGSIKLSYSSVPGTSS